MLNPHLRLPVVAVQLVQRLDRRLLLKQLQLPLQHRVPIRIQRLTLVAHLLLQCIRRRYQQLVALHLTHCRYLCQR